MDQTGRVDQLDDRDVLDVLAFGRIEVEGRIADASNATIKGCVTLDGVSFDCVYKPTRGERPLWDFPTGSLGRREVASYLVSAAMGVGVVPPTSWRETGPAGSGMCQRWIDVDEDAGLVDVVPVGGVPEGWYPVIDATDYRGAPITLIHADHPRLRGMAVFDVVVNNADRKGGHVLVGHDGAVFGVDHGLTFHPEDKVRTVLWGFAGQPLGPEITDSLASLAGALGGDLGEELELLLSGAELVRTAQRIDALRSAGVFPGPGGGWPPLPWPVF